MKSNWVSDNLTTHGSHKDTNFHCFGNSTLHLVALNSKERSNDESSKYNLVNVLYTTMFSYSMALWLN